MSRQILPLLMAIIGLQVIVHAAIFPTKGAVIPLGSSTWKNKLNDGNLAIVAFTAPWCGHCKTLAPEYQKAAESLSPLIPFYNVDCDQEGNKQLCNAEGVKGFPTIKAYTKAKNHGRDYSNQRTAGPIIEWASDQISIAHVKKLKTAAEIEHWRAAKPDQIHAILLHPSNPSLPLMWKVLSERLSDKVHFGFLKDDKGDGRKAVGIDTKNKKVDGVKVVTWTANGKRQVYDAGPLKFEPLLKYFKSLVSNPDSDDSVDVDNDDFDDGYTTEYITTVIESTAAVPVPTEGKSAKLKEQEAKWEEEERRDRIRREKREKERLARMFEDQERVTDEQDEAEDSGPQTVVTPVQDASEPEIAQPAEVHSAGLSDKTTAPDPAVPAEPVETTTVIEGVMETAAPHASHGSDQSAGTPLEAASDEFQHGTSDPEENVVIEKHNDQSASTPLEQEADEFEHGQHQAVWDESPTEERIRDEL